MRAPGYNVPALANWKSWQMLFGAALILQPAGACRNRYGLSHQALSQVCVIDTVWRENTNGFSSRTVFIYDSVRQLLKRVHSVSSGTEDYVTLKYNGHSILMRGTSTALPAWASRDSLALNEAGLLVYRRIYPREDRAYWYAERYTYDINNRVLKKETVDSASPVLALNTEHFHWRDADLHTFVNAHGSEERYEYYTGLTNRPGDGLDITYNPYYQFQLVRNAHLLKSTWRGGVWASDHSYQFDDRGRIKSATTKVLNRKQRDTTVTTETYSYKCW